MNNNDGSSSIKGAVLINAAGKYSSVIFQLIFSALLSRILTPAEFGVVTVINVFVIFFELFSDLGIGAAIIQKRELTEVDISHIFGFTVYLGVGLAVLFCILSYGIADYYGNAVYVPLGEMFAVSILLTSCNVVPNALLMKNKKFITVAIRTVVASIVSYLVAVIMALNGLSYYSLVIRSVVMTTILLIWNIKASRLKISLRTNLKSIKKIWGYSLYQFGASIINYFQRNLDSLFVGKYLGEEQLGYYNKSYSLMQYPITYLSQVITPVLHPIMAEHQNDKTYIYDQYIRIIQLLSSISCFVCSFFFCASKEIVLIMFGDQWVAAIAPFSVISLSIWAQMLTGTVGCIMQSLNDTKNLFRMCIVSLGVSIVGIIVGVMRGDLSKLAWCIVLIYYLHFFIYFYVLVHVTLRKRLIDFFKAIRVDLLSLIAMIMFAIAITRFLTLDNILQSFLLKGFLLTCLYLVILLITRRYKLIINIFNRKRR